MTNYDAFRNHRLADQQASNKIAGKFIKEGNLATTITYGGSSLDAALAYVNQEETDKVYVYLDKPQTLNVGGTFIWSDWHFLIVDEFKIVKEVVYNKYLAYECNFSVNNVWGWFRGPMKTYINTQIQDDVVITSQAKPMAILPNGTLTIGQKFMIGDRPWIVIESDDTSTTGLSYYSLEATVLPQPNTPEIPAEEEEEEGENPNIVVHPLDEVVVTTQDGYFTCDKPIKIIRTLTEVRFTVPFGYQFITVERKNNDVVETIVYEVV